MGLNISSSFVQLSSKMKLFLVLAALLAPALTARLPYIVGGKDVDYAGKWPWQASLQRHHSHGCGATLISRRWLVTAARCVGGSVNTLTIVLGMHDLYATWPGTPTRYSIEQIIVHPNWGPSKPSYPNDIALIKLRQDADTNSQYIGTIALAEPYEHIEGNSNCYITGWGNTVGGQNSQPRILQELKTRTWWDSECRQYHQNQGPWHICTNSYNGGACNGDSGGPLVCNISGSWKLVGAASFVFGPCITSYPSIYARVPHFRSWIKQTTGV